MARRTKRPAVVWLPLDINNRIQLAGASTSGVDNAGFQIGLIAPSGGPQGSTMWPVVKDEPQNITGAQQTLSDLEGSAYRLRRVVGKIFVSPAQIGIDLSQQESTSWMVTVGLLVVKVNANGVQLAADITYDVQALDSTRDPWIWRRSWALTNKLGQAALDIAEPGSRPLIFPGSSAEYGSVADGPHIDAKTARVISDEERLFFVASAVGLDGQPQGVEQVISIFGEVRVLASMRKSSGNRRNASR